MASGAKPSHEIASSLRSSRRQLRLSYGPLYDAGLRLSKKRRRHTPPHPWRSTQKRRVRRGNLFPHRGVYIHEMRCAADSSSFPSPGDGLRLSVRTAHGRGGPVGGFIFLYAAEKVKAGPAAPAAPKPVVAVRAGGPISIDGRLEEEVWKSEGSEGFTQNDPKDGEPSTEKTRVWVAYDDKAVYVAAFCYDSEPAKIIEPAGPPRLRRGFRLVHVRRRSLLRQANRLPVRRQPRRVRSPMRPSRTMSTMTIPGTASGKARPRSTAQGWTVEMKIPFNQIRFSKKDEYVWGVNFTRVIKRKNERAAFAWVPKNEAAYRLHVSPVSRASAGSTRARTSRSSPTPWRRPSSGPPEPGNPFETGSKTLGNLGFDAKVGLKSNLTLDATVNPDFGQVEVDPAVVNLSAYETYYEEKRPFFIEGASIFDGFGRGGVYLNANINWPQPTFFYSRRIGRSPQGFVTTTGDFVSTPRQDDDPGRGQGHGQARRLERRVHQRPDGPRVRRDRRPRAPGSGRRSSPSAITESSAPRRISTRAATVSGSWRQESSRDLQTETLSALLNKNAFSGGRGRLVLSRQGPQLCRRRLVRRDEARRDARRHPPGSRSRRMHYYPAARRAPGQPGPDGDLAQRLGRAAATSAKQKGKLPLPLLSGRPVPGVRPERRRVPALGLGRHQYLAPSRLPVDKARQSLPAGDRRRPASSGTTISAGTRRARAPSSHRRRACSVISGASTSWASSTPTP